MADEDSIHDAVERLEWDERKENDDSATSAGRSSPGGPR